MTARPKNRTPEIQAALLASCPHADFKALASTAQALTALEDMAPLAATWARDLDSASDFVGLVERSAAALQFLGLGFDSDGGGADAKKIIAAAIALADQLQTLARRIGAIERLASSSAAQAMEIKIHGGLADDDFRNLAFIPSSNEELTREVQETPAQFRSRARAAAAEKRANFVVFGGLETN